MGSVGTGLWRTLCADLTYKRAQAGCVEASDTGDFNRLPEEKYAEVSVWFWHALRGIVSKDDTEVAVRTATAKRRFFVATDGTTGLGPAKMREGDEIHILQGGRTPFVLRPVAGRSVSSGRGDTGSPVHEMIGDCYADKLMDGDAVKHWTASDWETKPNKVYLV